MKRFSLILPFVLVWFAPASAMAAPGMPHQFYGVVSFESGSTPDGLLVEAKVNGAVVGTSQTKDGKYGYNPNLLFAVNTNGDWTGETVNFFVKGIDTGESYGLAKGSYTNLNLTVPGSAVPAVPTPPPTTGGGGGGGGAPAPTTTTTATTVPIVTQTPKPVIAEVKPQGKVLGATSFRFNTDLEFGMESDAVVELQKNLTSAGVYSGPITGYFGSLTRAAVKKYQEKNGIKSTGYFGPLTREKMNGSKVAGVSTSKDQQIASLKTQIAELMKLVEELLKAKAAQTR